MVAALDAPNTTSATSARIARIHEFTARQPTLALAGNAYHGVGIPQCLHSGETAAQRVAAHFNR